LNSGRRIKHKVGSRPSAVEFYRSCAEWEEDYRLRERLIISDSTEYEQSDDDEDCD